MTDNEQLDKLYRNYKELEDGSQDRLLLVGKKLLGIKKLVMQENTLSGENRGLKFDDEKLV